MSNFTVELKLNYFEVTPEDRCEWFFIYQASIRSLFKGELNPQNDVFF